MKKTIFYPFIVIFTAFFASNSFAGSGLLSINGQDTKKAGAVVATPQQVVDLLFYNKPIPGVQYYDACDDNCFKNNIAVFTAVGRKGIYDILNEINTTNSGVLATTNGKPVVFSDANSKEAEKILRAFMKAYYLEFSSDGTFSGVKNTLNGEFGQITHSAASLSGWYGVLDFGKNYTKKFIATKLNCVNVPNIATSKFIEEGKAKIMETNPVNPGGGTVSTGTGLTPDQQKLVEEALKKTGTHPQGGFVFQPIIINAPSASATGGAGGTATNTVPNYSQSAPKQPDPFDNSRWGVNTTPPRCNCGNLQCAGGSWCVSRTTTKTTTGNQHIACNTCPGANNNGAWNRSDVAYVENQLAQNNRYAKRTANATTATAIGVWLSPFINLGINYLARLVMGRSQQPIAFGDGSTTNWGGSNWVSTNTGTSTNNGTEDTGWGD